jgi:hypothetical protein
MNTQPPPPATAQQAVDPPLSPPRRRVDGIDLPARPLGPKRAALHLRRRLARPAAPISASRRCAEGVLSLASQISGVAFAMHTTPSGLLIERTQHQAVGTRLVQALVFADRATFDRWCESDPIRFQDPMLYDRLRRHGHDALDGQG